MSLMGADGTYKAAAKKFAIDAAEGGTSSTEWEIYLRDLNAEVGGTKITRWHCRKKRKIDICLDPRRLAERQDRRQSLQLRPENGRRSPYEVGGPPQTDGKIADRP